MTLSRIQLSFATKPQALPAPAASGRVVVLDVAFANGDDFKKSTLPFLTGLGDRLALWVDHHDHVAWPEYQRRANFLLVGKLSARACPQLVTPEVVQRAGHVDHVLAHADFDGCMAAAKFLNGGTPPYPESDEDSRFSDAPGQGFTCSPRGLRLCRALDEARSAGSDSDFVALLHDLAWSLVHGSEPAELCTRLDALAQAQEQRVQGVLKLLPQATRPHRDVLMLIAPASVTPSDKKILLREMEDRARVAIVAQGEWTTAATYDDGEQGLNLGGIAGFTGQRGYAWTQIPAQEALANIIEAIDRNPE